MASLCVSFCSQPETSNCFPAPFKDAFYCEIASLSSRSSLLQMPAHRHWPWRRCCALLLCAGETAVASGNGSQVACFPGSFRSCSWPLGFSAVGTSFCSSAYFPLWKLTSVSLTLDTSLAGFPSTPFPRSWSGGSQSLALATDSAWGYDGWGRNTCCSTMEEKANRK